MDLSGDYKGIFNQTRTVKIPAFVLEKVGKVWTERARFVEERVKEPHAHEIAGSVEMSVEIVRQIFESGNGVYMVRIDSRVWPGKELIIWITSQVRISCLWIH